MNINWQEPIDAAEQVVAEERGKRVSHVSLSVRRSPADAAVDSVGVNYGR